MVNVSAVTSCCSGVSFWIDVLEILGKIIFEANKCMSRFLFDSDIISLLIYMSKLSPVTFGIGFFLSMSTICCLLAMQASSCILNFEDGDSTIPKFDNLVKAWIKEKRGTYIRIDIAESKIKHISFGLQQPPMHPPYNYLALCFLEGIPLRKRYVPWKKIARFYILGQYSYPMAKIWTDTFLT